MTMISEIHQGIVLRYSMIKSEITIFDQKDGKITGRVCSTKKTFVHGALIVYRREQWRDRYSIYFCDQIALPASWVTDDFLFFHFLLEIGDLFLPNESPEPQIFEWYLAMYNVYHAPGVFLKKLFVCRFFLFAGAYVDGELIRNISFLNLISGPIDIMLATTYDECLHKKIVGWIHECIHTHARAHRLKTAHFLLAMDSA